MTVGRTARTVVGVMLPRFGYPLNQQVWMPLLVQDAPPREGPAVQVFGRLADGASWQDAAAELDVVSARFAADQPTTHARLRTRVRAFAGRTPGDPLRPEDLAVHAIVLLLLGALSANVATLIFARTAMRASELVIRHALGARRARVIAQIVTEGLVLALAAAVCGLIVAQTTVRYVWARATQIIGDGLPFWVDLKLEPVTPCVRRTCAPSATCSTDRGAAAGVTCFRGRSRSRVVLGSRSRPARPANTTTG